MSIRSFVLLSAMMAALWTAQPAAARDPFERATVTQLAYSPDGQRVIATYFVPAMNRPGTDWRSWGAQWDLKTGKGLMVPNAAGAVAFAPDGQMFAMGIGERPGISHRLGSEVRLGLWQFGQREPSKVLAKKNDKDSDGTNRAGRAVVHAAQDSVIAAAFHPDGKRVVSVSDHGQVLLWPIGEDAKPQEIVNFNEQFQIYRWGGIPATTNLAFDDEAKTLTLAATTIDRKRPDVELATAWRVDLATKQVQRTDAKPTEPRPTGVNRAQAPGKTNGQTWRSPDGKRIASVDDAGTIRVIDRDSGEIVKSLRVEDLAK